MSKEFRVGDKIKLIVNVGPCRESIASGGVRKGDTLTCVHDSEPLKGYRLGNGKVDCEWANCHKDYFEEKTMKREDKINIEITLREAAQIYAIIAQTTGTVGFDVYKTLKDAIDPTGEAYDKCIDDKFEPIHYMGVQREFEAAIFDKKTPAQIELESLQTKISELQVQADKLQGLINK